MDLFIAVLLGIIQGILEFLPVSSCGHLIIFERIAGFGIPPVPFHVCVHIGSAVAVVFTLRKDVLRLVTETGCMFADLFHNIGEYLKSVRRGDDATYIKIVRTNYRKLAVLILAACVPTAVVGFLLERAAESISMSVMYTGIGLFLTGIVLLVSSMLTPKNEMPRDIPVWKMLLIGLIQGISFLPGISRFGVTLAGGIFSGMSIKTSVRVSFLLLVPVSVGALIAELFIPGTTGFHTAGIWPVCLAGCITSAVAGIFMMKRVLRIFMARDLTGFAYYCFLAGLVAILLGFFGL